MAHVSGMRSFSSKNDNNLESRIGRSITPQPNGCWIFRNNPDSYGNTRDIATVHRFVYETLVEPIPRDHHLHHTCHTPACCNPDHLLIVTPLQHARIHAQKRKAS